MSTPVSNINNLRAYQSRLNTCLFQKRGKIRVREKKQVMTSMSNAKINQLFPKVKRKQTEKRIKLQLT